MIRRWTYTLSTALLAHLCFASLLLAGCQDDLPPRWREHCEKIALCDAPPSWPEHILIVCDRTDGSSCELDPLTRTLDVVLGRAAMRPGSQVALWQVGATLAATTLLGEQVSPKFSGKGERAQKKHAERWQAQAKDFLLIAAKPLFSEPQARRSPLVESISKVALASETSKLARHIIVISDLREVSTLGNFECGALPLESPWLARLERRELLRPASLQGVRVSLTFADAAARGRCLGSFGRTLKIRGLWSAALKRAGANVFFTSGPVEFAAETAPKAHKE